jgi:hypothetical protein
MKLLLHGVAIANKYLVDDGELVAVSAVNARSAFLMVMPGCEGLWRKLVMERLPKVYQLDSHGEQIAVYE